MLGLVAALVLTRHGGAALQAKPNLGNGMAFIANGGQWDSRAQYGMPFGGGNLWLTSSGAVFDLHRDSLSAYGAPGPGLHEVHRQGQAFRFDFLGAHASTPVASGLRKGYLNYFFGSDRHKWVSHARQYSEVTYSKIYPGIDLVWSQVAAKPTFELLVHAGADPKTIQFKFTGATASVGKNAIVVSTRFGPVQIGSLVSYQTVGKRRVRVASNFTRLPNGQFGFSIPKFDRTRTLVIDPTYYATYFGSSASTSVAKSVVDSNGDLYIAGSTTDDSFPVTFGAYDSSGPSVGSSGYVAELAPDASEFIFATYLDAPGATTGATGIALDSGGNVVVAGSVSANGAVMTAAGQFPTVAGAYKTFYAGGSDKSDGFVARLTPGGDDLVSSTYVGGSYQDAIVSLALVGDDAMVCGFSSSAGDFPWLGGFDTNPISNPPNGLAINGFLARISTTGGLVASTLFQGTGSTSWTFVYDLAVNGNVVYFAGFVPNGTSATEPLSGTYGGGGDDAYVASCSADLSKFRGGSYCGGSGSEAFLNLAFDPLRNVLYASGFTNSGDFPCPHGWNQSLGSGFGPPGGQNTSEAVICAFDGNTLSEIYGTYLDEAPAPSPGQPQFSAAYGVALDPSGNPLTLVDGDLLGSTNLNPPVIAANATLLRLSRNLSAALETDTLFNSTGANAGSDSAGGLATDAYGTAFIVGTTLDPVITPSANAFQSVIVKGSQPAFVESISLTQAKSLTVSPTLVTGGSNVTGTVYLSGPAPSGGATFSLYADSGSVSPPASITVPAGSTSATFSFPSVPVSALSTVHLFATYLGQTVSRAFQVDIARLASVRIAPGVVAGGTGATMSVQLTGPAADSGVVVNLTSSAPGAASVQSPVVIPSGSSSAQVPITTTPVSASATVTFTATADRQRTGTLSVLAPSIQSLVAGSQSVAAGSAVGFTVTLSGPAPTAGSKVALIASPASALTVPPSVVIPAGSSSSTFMATAGNVASPTNVAITATLNGTASEGILVASPVVQSLTTGQAALDPGNSATFTITLSNPAPSAGATVSITTSQPAALTVPAQVLIPGGATSATFTVTAGTVASQLSVSVTAAYNGSASASILVLPPDGISVQSLDDGGQLTVSSGSSVTFTITLSTAAPTGGLTVLVGASPSSALVVPSQVVVPAGATTATFTATAGAVTSQTFVTVTATYNGSASLTILVLPAGG